MKFIYATYNQYCNSIDITIFDNMLLRIDYDKAADGLMTTPNSQCALCVSISLFFVIDSFLCWKYHKSRNPLPIMVGHAIIDVTTVIQILATSMIPGLYEMMCSM